MKKVRRRYPRLTFRRFRAGATATMELAFPRSADLQRRLTALLTGVLGHRRASQASNSATGSNEVFSRVLHSASVRLIARRREWGNRELAAYSVRHARITHWFRAERSAPSARLREMERLMYRLKMTDAAHPPLAGTEAEITGPKSKLR